MVVVWRVTERCNLGCKFCAYDRDLSRERWEADPEQVLTFGKTLSEYQKTTGNSVLVSWLGGEPFLWPHLTRLTETFSAQYRLRISTTTNGTSLASPALREHLIACYAELTISVDGLATFHDASRGRRDGFSSLRDSIRTLVQEKGKQGRGPVLRVNVVLMRDNLRMLEDLCKELCSWGIQEISFNQLGGMDRPEFFPAHRLLPQDVLWLEENLPRLTSFAAGYGVRILGGSAYLRRIAATANSVPLPVDDCRAGQTFLFIDERGRAAPCSFTPAHYGIFIDEIRSRRDLLELPARFAKLRATKRSASCEDCHSTQLFEKFSV